MKLPVKNMVNCIDHRPRHTNAPGWAEKADGKNENSVLY